MLLRRLNQRNRPSPYFHLTRLGDLSDKIAVEGCYKIAKQNINLTFVVNFSDIKCDIHITSPTYCSLAQYCININALNTGESRIFNRLFNYNTRNKVIYFN